MFDQFQGMVVEKVVIIGLLFDLGWFVNWISKEMFVAYG